MAKVRTTLTIDDEVLRAVKHRAARGGKRESEVIEEALRRDLGVDLLDELWSRADMSEKEASKLAVQAQHETRPKRSRRKSR
jgi:metal-responsive CopG/Arc/MetJ family transcriptional regulator